MPWISYQCHYKVCSLGFSVWSDWTLNFVVGNDIVVGDVSDCLGVGNPVVVGVVVVALCLVINYKKILERSDNQVYVVVS